MQDAREELEAARRQDEAERRAAAAAAMDTSADNGGDVMGDVTSINGAGEEEARQVNSN